MESANEHVSGGSSSSDARLALPGGKVMDIPLALVTPITLPLLIEPALGRKTSGVLLLVRLSSPIWKYFIIFYYIIIRISKHH